jgi:hypothetical protein
MRLAEAGESGVDLALGAGLQDLEPQPLVLAASCRSRTVRSALGVFGFTSRAITLASGTSSDSSSTRLDASSTKYLTQSLTLHARQRPPTAFGPHSGRSALRAGNGSSCPIADSRVTCSFSRAARWGGLARGERGHKEPVADAAAQRTFRPKAANGWRVARSIPFTRPCRRQFSAAYGFQRRQSVMHQLLHDGCGDITIIVAQPRCRCRRPANTESLGARFQIIGQPATMLVALRASAPLIGASHWWDGIYLWLALYAGCGSRGASAGWKRFAFLLS